MPRIVVSWLKAKKKHDPYLCLDERHNPFFCLTRQMLCFVFGHEVRFMHD